MTIVIPRSVWRPSYSNGAAVIGTAEWINAGKELWLHHDTNSVIPGPNATLEEDCAYMRKLESIGQSLYRAGISYTWLVLPSSRVFEGHSIDRQGTHTYQRNNRARAICLAGNYEIHSLPDKMALSVASLLKELDATLDGGHRDVYATACPGQHAYARIPVINALSKLPSVVVPTGKDQDNDMMFVGVYDKGWKTPLALLHGDHFTGGFSIADVNALRADPNNGSIPLMGVTFAQYNDMRQKGDLLGRQVAALEKLVEQGKATS